MVNGYESCVRKSLFLSFDLALLCCRQWQRASRKPRGSCTFRSQCYHWGLNEPRKRNEPTFCQFSLTVNCFWILEILEVLQPRSSYERAATGQEQQANKIYAEVINHVCWKRPDHILCRTLLKRVRMLVQNFHFCFLRWNEHWALSMTGRVSWYFENLPNSQIPNLTYNRWILVEILRWYLTFGISPILNYLPVSFLGCLKVLLRHTRPFFEDTQKS